MNNGHSDARHITLHDVEQAAQASEITPRTAAQRIRDETFAAFANHDREQQQQRATDARPDDSAGESNYSGGLPHMAAENTRAETNLETNVESERAVWSTAFQNDLPDASFAYIEPGGKKDAEGKTTPRTLRHLPYKDKDGTLDEAHVRNGLARLPQTDIPDAAKASARKKLVAAAKSLGIEVSEDGRFAAAADETRASGADTADLTRITLPAEIRITDAAKREFEVCATSEAVDSYGTIFGYEATKDAFTRWKRNIREMHAPLAVGRGIDIRFDDATKKTYVHGRISRGADPTWLKLEDGVLQGASIGASNVTWERRVIDGKDVPYATRYDLIELSLVDNPSNADAYGVSLIRSAAPTEGVWQADDEAAPETSAEARAAIPSDSLPPMVGAESTSVDLGPLTAEEPAPAEVAISAATGPKSAYLQRVDAINERRARDEEVRRAGDLAEAAVGGIQLGEDFPTYAARVAAARGAAEMRVLLAQKERDRMPHKVSQTAEAQPAAAEMGNSAIQETAPRPADATSNTAADSDVGGPAIGAQATLHDDDEQHEHTHEHVGADGKRFTHSHLHGHREAEHDHMHTFRNGLPTDARLVKPEAQRLDQSGKDDGVSAAAKAHPVSGSAQKSGAAESGLEKMTPAAVGHPVPYNVETSEAYNFGVPEEAEGREAGDEDITLESDAQNFHVHPAGGPTTSSGPIATGAPTLASRPPEPSRIPDHKPTYGESQGEGRAAASAKAPAEGDRDDEPGYAASEGEDSDADDVRESEDETAAARDDERKDERERSAASAETTRVGARISAEGRVAVHAMRDSANDAVKRACEHCGCPECAGLLAVLNGGPYDAAGQHPASNDETANTSNDTALFGELRVFRAQITRVMTETLAAQREALVASFARELAAVQAELQAARTQLAETLAETRSELAAAIGDAQYTLVDHQRGYAAQVTRAVENQLPDVVRAAVDATVSQRLEGLAASVAEVKAGVEEVANQPAAWGMNGPISAVADKLLPLETRSNRGMNQLAPQDEIAALQRIAPSITHPQAQTEMALRIMQLQQQQAGASSR